LKPRNILGAGSSRINSASDRFVETPSIDVCISQSCGSCFLAGGGAFSFYFPNPRSSSRKTSTRVFAAVISAPTWHSTSYPRAYYSTFDASLCATSHTSVLLSDIFKIGSTAIATAGRGRQVRTNAGATNQPQKAAKMRNLAVTIYRPEYLKKARKSHDIRPAVGSISRKSKYQNVSLLLIEIPRIVVTMFSSQQKVIDSSILNQIEFNKSIIVF
jgi:hypothetical protein